MFDRLKRALFLAAFVAALFVWVPWCSAATLLNDSFDSTALVDSGHTTARVDTSRGLVELKKRGAASAISLVPGQPYQYAVVTKDGVRFFTLDAATGAMSENPALSVPGITDAVGVVVNEGLSMWVLTETELRRYDFDGSGMSLNPVLTVTGLADVLSVSASPAGDSVMVLSRSGAGTGAVTYFQQGPDGMVAVPALSTDTGMADPVGACLVPGSPDLLAASKSEVRYYSFDGQGYAQNPSLSAAGLSGAVSVSAPSASSYAVIEDSRVSYYLSQGGGVQRADALSTGPIDSPAAVAARPDAYEYAVLTGAGEVRYYTFDQSSGGMRENPALFVSGLDLTLDYVSPGEYRSRAVSGGPYSEVRLTAEQDLPAGTSVTWEVSTDGGASFTAVTPGVWATVPRGSSFVVRAVLATSDRKVTPQVMRVVLEATEFKLENLTVTAAAAPAPGQALPSASFPVRVQAGSEVVFSVDTSGYAESVSALLSDGTQVALTAASPGGSEDNIWTGRFTVPPDIAQGVVLGITVTAYRGTATKDLSVPAFIRVEGRVYQSGGIRLTY